MSEYLGDVVMVGVGIVVVLKFLGILSGWYVV
jgi:hypothetical protein